MWPLPRELLWAIIFTLSVFLVAQWKDPHGQFLPIGQQQAKDSNSGERAGGNVPAAPIERAGAPQQPQAQQHTTEIFGVKPGEWLLVFVTWMLWLATARLVSGADRNSERQLRAYLGVHSGAVEPQQSGEQRGLLTRVTIRNSGQTPAYDVRTWIGVQIEHEGGEPFVFPENLTDRPASIIGPGVDAHMDIGFVIEPQYIEDMLNQRRRLFIWARVEYRDAFDKARFLTIHSENSDWVPGDKRFGIRAHTLGYHAN